LNTVTRVKSELLLLVSLSLYTSLIIRGWSSDNTVLSEKKWKKKKNTQLNGQSAKMRDPYMGGNGRDERERVKRRREEGEEGDYIEQRERTTTCVVYY